MGLVYSMMNMIWVYIYTWVMWDDFHERYERHTTTSQLLNDLNVTWPSRQHVDCALSARSLVAMAAKSSSEHSEGLGSKISVETLSCKTFSNLWSSATHMRHHDTHDMVTFGSEMLSTTNTTKWQYTSYQLLHRMRGAQRSWCYLSMP